jgi:Asp-tRNA(Asn)/Glu-tRNA(Gln) amidotransferase A subunit family amidase
VSGGYARFRVARTSDTASIRDLAGLGVLDAAALLRARHVSATELLAACTARIEARNGGAASFDGAPAAVNAWIRLYPERATKLAGAADERLDRERDAAPLLCGIPLGLKDLFAVAGLPLTASSRVLDGDVAAEDCTAWARLRDQGMVLVGHTHTQEFAAGGTTDQVGNPWDTALSAGGSSGGSAAAVATGMVPVALGTDTLGSLRIPSARSTRRRASGAAGAGRGALVGDPPGRDVGASSRVRRPRRALSAEHPGARGRRRAEHRSSEVCRRAGSPRSLHCRVGALARRPRRRLVLEPTVPVVAQARGEGYDPGHAGGEGDPLIAFTSTWDLTGFPVAALPAELGARSGLPVGVSLVARRGADEPLVQAAIDLQQHALPAPAC